MPKWSQQHQVTLTGNTAGALALISSGTMSLAGGNNITLSQAGNAITISGAAGGAETQTAISGISASNTLYTSGTVRFTGSQAVTVRSGTGQLVIIDAPAQSVQPETQTFLGGLVGSNATYTSGTVTLTGVGGGITVSSNTGQRIDLSVAAQTVQTQNLVDVTLSGNTSGALALISSGTMTLAGGNNITLSQAGNAVTISAPNLGGGGFSGGVSNVGNTAGATGVTGTRLVLAGIGNLTLAQATDANGGTVSFDQSVSNYTMGISDLGNTAGSSGMTRTRMVLVGTNDLTLSQATDAAGGTITFVAGAPLSYWENIGAGGVTATFEMSNAALNIYPLDPQNQVFPGPMTVSSVFFDISGTVSTGSGFTRSLSFGIYTQGTVPTEMYLLCSASTSWGTNAANMNMNDSMAGRRWVTLQSSQFNTIPALSKGRYWMALWNRSSSGAQTFAFSGRTGMYATGARSGFMSSASNAATTLGHYPFLGNYSVSFSTAMPATLVGSDINKANATAASHPRVIFNNVVSNII